MLKEESSVGNREEGAALFSVVLVVLLLSLMAVGVLAVSLSARQTVKSLESEDADKRIARSALTLFMKTRFYDADEQAFLQDRMSVLGRSVEVQVEFESGRININRASHSLLSALFMRMGRDEGVSRDMASAIIDWRDRDTDGAFENGVYLDTGGPRNGPFEAIGELMFVQGFDSETVHCIRPLVSVASLSSEVDLRFANTHVRSVIEWAHDNGWDDIAWPDPVLVETEQGVIGNANRLAGQAMLVRLSVAGDPEKIYEATIRFKSTSDMSYAMLSAVQQRIEPTVHSECPWRF